MAKESLKTAGSGSLERVVGRRFPIQISESEQNCPGQMNSIPWELIEPHEAQAMRNHGGQTLQRLAQRGGLSPCEAVAVLEDADYRARWPYAIYSREALLAHHIEATKRLRELCGAAPSNDQSEERGDKAT